MKQFLKAATGKLYIFFYAGFLCSTVAAQGLGSVVESQAFTPGQSRPATSNYSVGNSDAMSLLLDQIRDLQTEVQALRAMVEEQSFELRKIQRDSLSRYTNMDERLTGLEAGTASSAEGLTTGTPADADNGGPPSTTPPPLNQRSIPDNQGQQTASATSRPPSVRNIGRGTLEPVVLSEQQLYQMAYDSVIKSNFDLSIAEFDQYLSIYPQGRFVTNAHYWKGQAYLYLNRYTEAVESYEVIVNQAEESAKLADAMYGLALAYQGMGNIAQAKQLLNAVKRRFPNTGVANLADTRLLSLD